MEDNNQAKYEGFAIVEVMGHRTMAGYVKTEYFGSNAMIHVTQPACEPQERILERDEWINSEMCPAGTKIRVSREKAEAYIGAGSIYQLTPCTELQALKRQPETIEIIERVERKKIAAPAPHVSMLEDDDDQHDDDENDDDTPF